MPSGPRRAVLGLFSPTQALIEARKLAALDLYQIGDVELPNELAELGYPGEELMREALCSALNEVDQTLYCPDEHPQAPPAYIFIWESKHFGCRMYLKFKLKGTRKKPVLWIYSCHKAYF